MTTRRKSIEPDQPLTPGMFQILVALAEGDRHGYAIMQEIERRTDGAVELGAGTLYRTIKQLLGGRLIVEVKSRQSDHSQRRYYRLTPEGRRRAAGEARRLDNMVQWAKSADLLNQTRA